MRLAVIIVSFALSAAQAPATGVPAPHSTPERVVVTRPRGFPWQEALVGALAAGVVVALVAAGTEPRRRSTCQSPTKESR